jgi:WD40 repeat protein
VNRIAIIMPLLFALTSCAAFAQAAPQLEMVGEGVISTPDDEFGGALSPDGKSIYFAKSVPGSYLYVLCVSHLDDQGRWSAPEILPFSGQWRDPDPVLSPDGKTLLLVSDRPVDGKDLHHYHIWMSRLTDKGWGNPEVIRGPINEVDATQLFASMTSGGTIYFTSARHHKGIFEVFRSKLADGKYQEPEFISELSDGRATTIEAFIAPDESYIILGSFGRQGGLGSSDLYISYRENGKWSKPQNLGPVINSRAREYSPRVTPDGRYLIFASERGSQPTSTICRLPMRSSFVKHTKC